MDHDAMVAEAINLVLSWNLPDNALPGAVARQLEDGSER